MLVVERIGVQLMPKSLFVYNHEYDLALIARLDSFCISQTSISKR